MKSMLMRRVICKIDIGIYYDGLSEIDVGENAISRILYDANEQICER